MFYTWLLEIVHQQSGEVRKLEKQENLTSIAKWEKEINKSGWEIVKAQKVYN